MTHRSTMAAYLLIAVLSVAITGCGSDAAPTNVSATATVPTAVEAQSDSPEATEVAPTQTPKPVPTLAPTDTPAPTEMQRPSNLYLGDTAVQDGYFLSALGVEDPATPGLLYQPEAGQRLVAVEMIVGTLNGSQLSVNPLNATLVDSEGFTYQTELGGRDGQIATLDLRDGERLRGWIAFEIPDNAQPATLKFSTSLFGGQDLSVGLQMPPADHVPAEVEIARQAPELTALGSTVTSNGYSLSAVAVEDPATPGMLYQPQDGTRLVAVDLVVGNESGAALSVNPLYVTLVDSEGFVYEVELAGRDGQIDTVELGPGEKVRGWVAFQVPSDAQLESVKFAPIFSDWYLQTGVTQ